MACDDCLDGTVQNGIAFIVYTGGPPETPFASVRCGIPNDGVIRLYEPAVHADGRIQYADYGQEPPPLPEGYQRDATNPFILIPVWISCAHRVLRVQCLDNGILDIKFKCNLAASGKKGHEQVTNAFCQQCKVRLKI